MEIKVIRVCPARQVVSAGPDHRVDPATPAKLEPLVHLVTMESRELVEAQDRWDS